MFLTRMGFESKLVITGDRSQSDLPFSRQGAFTTCLEKLKDVSGIGIIHLKKCDIVRNRLIPLILECLDEIEWIASIFEYYSEIGRDQRGRVVAPVTPESSTNGLYPDIN